MKAVVKFLLETSSSKPKEDSGIRKVKEVR